MSTTFDKIDLLIIKYYFGFICKTDKNGNPKLYSNNEIAEIIHISQPGFIHKLKRIKNILKISIETNPIVREKLCIFIKNFENQEFICDIINAKLNLDFDLDLDFDSNLLNSNDEYLDIDIDIATIGNYIIDNYDDFTNKDGDISYKKFHKLFVKMNTNPNVTENDVMEYLMNESYYVV